jgi:hypothetical protein
MLFDRPDEVLACRRLSATKQSPIRIKSGPQPRKVTLGGSELLLVSAVYVVDDLIEAKAHQHFCNRWLSSRQCHKSAIPAVHERRQGWGSIPALKEATAASSSTDTMVTSLM